jgi:hypothetical protein
MNTKETKMIGSGYAGDVTWHQMEDWKSFYPIAIKTIEYRIENAINVGKIIGLIPEDPSFAAIRVEPPTITCTQRITTSTSRRKF